MHVISANKQAAIAEAWIDASLRPAIRTFYLRK
jgi:hypothetical protein